MKNKLPSLSATRRLVYAFAFITAAFLLTACSNDYANVLPEDCAGVVKIDLKSIADKAQLDENAELKDLKAAFLDKAQEEMDDSHYKELKEMLDNPEKLGIDLRCPVYLFAPSKSFPYAGLVAKTLDDEDFSHLLELFLKESDAGRLKEYDHCKMAVDNSGKMAVAFDGNSIMLAVAVDNDNGRIGRDVRRRFEEKKESSIYDNPAFKKMDKADDDVAACVMMKNVMKILPVDEREELKQMSKMVRMQDWSVIGGISFNDSDIKAYVEPVAETEEARKQMADAQEMLPGTEGKQLAMLPDDAFLVFGSALNGKKYWDYIRKIDFIRQAIDNKPEMADLIGRTVCAISGEWTAAIGLPADKDADMPAFEGLVDINDKAAVENILAKAEEQIPAKSVMVYDEDYYRSTGGLYPIKEFKVFGRDAAKGTYTLRLDEKEEGGNVVTMGTTAKTFYFSTRNGFSPEATPKKSLADAGFAKRIKGDMAFAVLDFTRLFEEEGLKQAMFGNKYSEYAEKFETAELHVSEDMRYTMELRFRDLAKKENPLTLLADMFFDAARTAGGF